jgi:hypothetical protein
VVEGVAAAFRRFKKNTLKCLHVRVRHTKDRDFHAPFATIGIGL